MAVKFNRRLRAKAIVDMAPMIDIVFQLVIFFMVATTFKTTTGMELVLPNAENVSAITETPLQITVINSQEILVGNRKTNLDGLESLLSESSGAGSGDRRSVVLSGDRKIEYGLLISIMDILKGAGYDSLDLALDKKSGN